MTVDFLKIYLLDSLSRVHILRTLLNIWAGEDSCLNVASQKFQFQGYYFFWFLYYGLYCISFYLFDNVEGRILAIQNAVTWKAERTNFIYNSLK